MSETRFVKVNSPLGSIIEQADERRDGDGAKAFAAGVALVEVMAKAMNSLTMDTTSFAVGVAFGLLTEHRTLQQKVAGTVLLPMVAVLAAEYDSGRYDARNEQAAYDAFAMSQAISGRYLDGYPLI